MEVYWFILLGVMIGCFSGFFGIGGGIILTPLLLLFGFPPTLVIGTSLMLSLGTSISGAIAHFQMKNIQWRFVIFINIFGIIGTQIAHPVMLFMESKGYAEISISFLYILLLGFFAFTLLRKAKPLTTKKEEVSSPTFVICLLGLGAGIISSALGVSGGFFIVPLLITFLHFKTAHAVGTALASVIFIVTSGLISYSLSSELDFLVGLLLILGTLIGAPIGAKATSFFSEPLMKKLLGTLYICMIASVISNLVSLELVGLAVIFLFTSLFFSLLIFKIFKATKKKRSYM